MGDVKILKRRLSESQRTKQSAIIAKATQLLSEYGNEVSMEMVSAAAEVSRSTLYRYFTSREHLLAEVTLTTGNQLIRLLNASPENDDTVGQRIQSLCGQISKMAEHNPKLLTACIANLSSDHPAVVDAQQEIEMLVGGIFSSISSSPNWEVPESTQKILFRYLLGAFVLATTGKLEYSELARGLSFLCESLFCDSWEQTIY